MSSSGNNGPAPRYVGSSIALLSNLGFSLMDTTAQSCTRDGMSPGQVAFGRMANTLPILCTYVFIRQPDGLAQLDPHRRTTTPRAEESTTDTNGRSTLFQRNPALAARLIWLRSILISLSLCLLYAGLDRIALSEFISIASTRSFLTGFLCWIFLREVFGWRLVVASAISTLAVVLIVQPPWLFGEAVSRDASSRALGFLFCIANLVVDAMERPDPVVITLACAMTCVFIAPLYMILAGETLILFPPLLVILKLSAVAITGLIAQIGLIMALQRETGGTVAVIAYSQIPFGVIIQSLVLLGIPNIVQGVGMMIIAVSGIWAIIGESNEGTNKDRKDRDGYALLSSNGGEEGIPEEVEMGSVPVKPV